MSPFDVSESDKMTLVTADDPPQRHIVSRSRLTVLSRVFRDLLSTPTTAEDEQKQEIPLTEKAEELKGFLMVLQEEEEKLSTLEDDDEWFALARMADKFDCKVASREVLCRAWEALAEGHGYFSFCLATLIDNEQIIRRIGWEAVDEGWHLERPCPARWTERLEKARKQRPSQMRDKLLDANFNWHQCGTGCTYGMLELATERAICKVMRYYLCSKSVEKQFREELLNGKACNFVPTICEHCINQLCATAGKIDKELPLEMDVADLG